MSAGDETPLATPAAAPYQPQRYWTDAARLLARRERSPLTAVVYTGAPNWLNRLVDRDQRRAVDWALRRCPSVTGALALDVGAGVGRWSARLAARGAHPVSLDLTRAMLTHARRRGAVDAAVTATAVRLPFRAESFDVILSVTVLQHLLAEEQEAAIAEIAFVCRPGGRVVLVELTDTGDRSPIVTPRPVAWWRDQFAAQGLQLVALGGQEYQPISRLLRRLDKRRPGADAAGARPGGGRRVVRRSAAFVNGASYVLEPALALLLPTRLARHGVFIFTKEDQESGRQAQFKETRPASARPDSAAAVRRYE